MKKTVNINLGGRPFVVDEDAYSQLDGYIRALKRHFVKTEGSDEIIADIEDGLAHILHMNLGKRKIVTIEDVKQAIRSMGTPDDFEVGPDMGQEEKTGTSSGKEYTARQEERPTFIPRKSRKLYRDEENGMIAGVCAGIANYFDVSPLLVRIIFVIGLLPGVGSPLVFYILLWFLIPPAHTPAERMHMLGSDINLDNIVRRAEEEIRDLADRLTEWTEKKINRK